MLSFLVAKISIFFIMTNKLCIIHKTSKKDYRQGGIVVRRNLACRATDAIPPFTTQRYSSGREHITSPQPPPDHITAHNDLRRDGSYPKLDLLSPPPSQSSNRKRGFVPKHSEKWQSRNRNGYSVLESE